MSNGNKNTQEPGEFTFEVVWENITPALVEEVNNFWVSEHALPRSESVESRARQLLVIVRDAHNKLIAVSTAERNRIPELLNNIFYYYRVFVGSAHRNKGLVLPISHRAREHLHKRFLSGEDTIAKGFYVAIENPILQKVHTQAVLVIGGIDHPFIGVDEHGRHLRVGWFDGAKID